MCEDLEYVAAYSEVALRAISVGWHLPTFITKRQHDEFSLILDEYAGDALDEALFRRVRGMVLNPRYTTRLTYIWYNKRRLNEIAFLVDEAIQSLYFGFFSAGATLALTAFEGGLRRIVGGNVNPANLGKKLSEMPMAVLPQRGDAYRKSIKNYVVRYLFVNTNSESADLDKSGLNRHNLNHGIHSGRAIRERDVVRALLACELLAEFERCRSGDDHTLYPDQGDEDLFALIFANYRQCFLELASKRDVRRIMSLDSQRKNAPKEEPFGLFEYDFDAAPLAAPFGVPEVEIVRNDLIKRGLRRE